MQNAFIGSTQILTQCKSWSVTHRGDVDDRMLTEAILPLLESLSDMRDVRPALRKRFGMPQ